MLTVVLAVYVGLTLTIVLALCRAAHRQQPTPMRQRSPLQVKRVEVEALAFDA